MQIKLLCIGDIVGRPGRQILADQLINVVKQEEIDCVIANAENAAGGSGLTAAIYDKLIKYGINLITLGDHIYRKREIIDVLRDSDRIVRPANLSARAAGKEYAFYTTSRGPRVMIISLLGRLFMSLPGDNPFHAIDRILSKVPADVKIIVVDIHAEATSEKIALGRWLDGRVSCVFGTHTHVTTADETILPYGTAYITDLGMTGAHESILGRAIEPVVKSLTTQMPYPFAVATGDVRMNSIIVTIDSHTGKTTDIRRLCLTSDSTDQSPYDSDNGKPTDFNNIP